MIRESLNRDKAVLWIFVKELMDISEKWAYILFRNLIKKSPSKTKLKESVLGLEIVSYDFS
jgi:hypothetical protein